jgi:hypothetical protein
LTNANSSKIRIARTDGQFSWASDEAREGCTIYKKAVWDKYPDSLSLF